MIGRADIEGSKSNVAMNAWLPQASYPCGNFSDTSSFKFRRSKGSLGHAFTVRIRTGNQNQTSFYPSVPHEISVLVELILGHLRYLLTDVPPQPNSPPDNVFRPDRPAEAGLGSKKRGIAPLPIHGISKITRIPLVRTSSELAVRRPGKAPEGAVPSPSPGRHAATRSRRGSSSSSPPTADGFGTGTPVPSPQSQSFSRGYGSILPTSLAYIVPSTSGCSPWRPDAVMSTTGRGRHSVLRIFKGRRGRTGHRATCGALPAAGPYLRLSLPFTWNLSPLRPSKFSFEYLLLPPRSAPTAAPPRLHAQGFAATAAPSLLNGAWHLPRRPGVGRALKRHPFSGLVDSAGMLTLEPFSEDQGRSAVHPARGIPPISFLAPCGFTHPLTRTHVRLLGPCFKTGRMGCPQAGAGSTQVYRRDGACCQPRSTRRHLHEPIDSSGFGRRTNPHRSTPRVDRRTGYRRSTSDRDASPAPIRFPPDNFKHSLTLFSKSFSSSLAYLFAIGLNAGILALDGIYRPIGAAFPNNPTRKTAPRGATGSGHDGALHPLWRPLPGDLGPGPPLRTLLQTTIRTARPSDFQAGLIPVRSPLLRESFRASTEGDSSLGQPHHKHGRPISAPMPCVPDKGCMVGGDAMRDAQAGVPSAGWLWAQLAFKNSMVHVHGSFCFAGFDNDPSAGSPTETLLRLLLPLNDKVQWNSRDVAGGEPPTSPRS
ncbi:hypothetical protein L1887_50111 [Cichorium endivia]|nr:hypothetical protein L1887_50111 [Cichorium endivia]